MLNQKRPHAEHPEEYKEYMFAEFALRDPQGYRKYREDHPIRRLYHIQTNPDRIDLIK